MSEDEGAVTGDDEGEGDGDEDDKSAQAKQRIGFRNLINALRHIGSNAWRRNDALIHCTMTINIIDPVASIHALNFQV